jgi:hypothetical protein
MEYNKKKKKKREKNNNLEKEKTFKVNKTTPRQE